MNWVILTADKQKSERKKKGKCMFDQSERNPKGFRGSGGREDNSDKLNYEIDRSKQSSLYIQMITFPF